LRNFLTLVRNEDAATAIEYSMIACFIAVAAIVAINRVAASTNNMWNTVGENVSRSM
jgi:pilus assembly protein Flp/PilA